MSGTCSALSATPFPTWDVNTSEVDHRLRPLLDSDSLRFYQREQWRLRSLQISDNNALELLPLTDPWIRQGPLVWASLDLCGFHCFVASSGSARGLHTSLEASGSPPG